MTTSLHFYFHGNQNSVFKAINAEIADRILTALNDSRIDSFMIGQQWINKNAIVTVVFELDQVVQEVPAETGTVESLPQPDSAT